MKRPSRPRSLSDIMPGLSKGVFGRKNMLFGKMLASWPQIAGKEISDKTTPMDLRLSGNPKKKDAKQAVLHLAMPAAFAVEFSYHKPLLIERLNVFFGYTAIKDIKIVQNSYITKNEKANKIKKAPIPLQKAKEIDRLVSVIEDSELQIALKNLGKSILSRQN